MLVCLTSILFPYATLLDGQRQDWQCRPDGSVVFPWDFAFGAAPVPSPLWEKSQFLSITLAFGSFSFADAKAIDVAWDLVIGRGGQLMVTLVTYPILRRAFIHSIERHPASFHDFAALSFDKASSGSLWQLGRSIGMRRRSGTTARINWRYILLFFAMLYVLMFPTWLSVMTGMVFEHRGTTCRPC